MITLGSHLKRDYLRVRPILEINSLFFNFQSSLDLEKIQVGWMSSGITGLKTPTAMDKTRLLILR